MSSSTCTGQSEPYPASLTSSPQGFFLDASATIPSVMISTRLRRCGLEVGAGCDRCSGIVVEERLGLLGPGSMVPILTRSAVQINRTDDRMEPPDVLGYPCGSGHDQVDWNSRPSRISRAIGKYASDLNRGAGDCYVARVTDNVAEVSHAALQIV
jgi:hypothetical protein